MSWTLWTQKIILILLLGTLPLAGRAAVLSFAYRGTVVAVDSAFAASLPADSGILTGAPITLVYSFESTTADIEPADTAHGAYPGTLQSWTLRVGSYSFVHDPAGSLNEIDVAFDLGVALYEAIDEVRPTPAIPSEPYLDSDIFFASADQIPPLADDSLPIVPPDPFDTRWGQSEAGIFDASSTALISIDITSICSLPCTLAASPVPTTEPASLIAMLLLSGCLAIAFLRVSQQRRHPRAGRSLPENGK